MLRKTGELEQREWVRRFADAMQHRGDLSEGPALEDLGRHLWETMADMLPEEAADLQLRSIQKDSC